MIRKVSAHLCSLLSAFIYLVWFIAEMLCTVVYWAMHALLEAASKNYDLVHIDDNGKVHDEDMNKQIRYHTTESRRKKTVTGRFSSRIVVFCHGIVLV